MDAKTTDQDKSEKPLFGLYETDFPLLVRVADRCTSLLILTDELLGEVTTEEANPLMWAEPAIRKLYDDIERLLQGLTY